MAQHTERNRRRFRSQLQGFVSRYGWRAYALPVLAVVTVVALLNAETANAHTQVAAPPRPSLTRPTQPSTTSAPLAADRSSVPTQSALTVEQIDGGADSTVCLSNRYATFVLVSISQQHMWACQGHFQVNTSPVTTGDVAAGDATPTGSWLLQNKQTDRYLIGPGYRDYVHYWVPFDGDVGFHDATWQTMPFGSPHYTSQGSHGCVHLPMSVVAWLYGWSRTGATVVTVQA